MRDLEEFDSQMHSNIVWSCSTADESNPHLFQKVADAVIARDLKPFKPQNLSNIAWAYTKAGQSNTLLFKKVVVHHYKRLGSIQAHSSRGVTEILRVRIMGLW